MDMEHQLLHFSPQEHFMGTGFFAIDGGHPAHFPNEGFLEPAGVDDDGRWVEDLMQLGDELFGGDEAGGDELFGGDEAGGDELFGGYEVGGDELFGRDEAGGDDASAAGMCDHQPWQCDDGCPEDPLPSISLDGDGSPPSEDQQGAGELASELRHEEGDDVSATTRKRRDRSKTIVSERKRRVRMKEKLYELRSLVPNITKMDKASIIADAVEYVKNLQARARKLKKEVSALEVRPRSPSRQEPQQQHSRRTAAGRRHQPERGAGCDAASAGSAGSGARVTHVGTAQVGEGRFFVTVECERRDGVAAPLCAAAESLAGFRVESSSIGRSGPDRVVSTLTLKVSEQVGDAAISEGSVKLWMMAALLKEGFRPKAVVESSI